MYHQASHEKPTFVFNYKKNKQELSFIPSHPSQNDFFYILQNRYYSACFSYISESIILKSEMYMSNLPNMIKTRGNVLIKIQTTKLIRKYVQNI